MSKGKKEWGPTFPDRKAHFSKGTVKSVSGDDQWGTTLADNVSPRLVGDSPWLALAATGILAITVIYMATIAFRPIEPRILTTTTTAPIVANVTLDESDTRSIIDICRDFDISQSQCELSDRCSAKLQSDNQAGKRVVKLYLRRSMGPDECADPRQE